MSDLSLYLRGGTYHVRGTIKIPGREKGIRVRESTGTSRLKDAETYRDKLRKEVVERELHGPGFSLTFADCVLIYLEKGGEKRFIKPIFEAFGHQRVKDISAESVSSFAIKNYGHMMPESVKRYFYTPLNAALRKGCKANNIAPISFEAPKGGPRKVVEPAPAEWFPVFFAHAHYRIAVVVLFLTTTGARVSEACRLRVSDFYPETQKALLRLTKNGKPRMVPLTPELTEFMQRLIVAENLGPDDVLFGYAARWSVNQAIERVCAAAGIKYFSSHKLGRHAFAARLLEGGSSLKQVQDAGGWSSIQIVAEAYGHLEANPIHQLMRDRGSQVSGLLSGTSLTQTPHQQKRKRQKDKETPVNSVAGMVGGTGVEPVTPTMSRLMSDPKESAEDQ